MMMPSALGDHAMRSWLSYQDNDEANDRENAEKAGGCGGGGDILVIDNWDRIQVRKLHFEFERRGFGGF